MKKILLFCGALWSIVRFTVFYFSLSGELYSSGDLFAPFLLFAFGSVHAVMAVGYCMTGVYPRSYRGIILLLATGQVFAFLTDAALLILGTGFFGLFYSEYETFTVLPGGFSPIVSAAVIMTVDFFFMICLLLLRNLPAEEQRRKDEDRDIPVLPEVNEIALEEED